MSTHIHATGKKGATRLNILNQIYNDSSLTFVDYLVDKLNKKKLTILDLGCGTGELACQIAENYTQNAMVYCQDISTAQLAITEKRIKSLGMSNVRVLPACDIIEMPNMSNHRFDIIHARWLLMHISSCKYPLVFKAIKSLLKPNGFIALEEPVFKHCKLISNKEYYEITNAYHYWYSLSLQIADKLNIDYNIGETLKSKLEQNIQKQATQYNVFQPLLETAEEKSVIELAVREGTEKVIDLGLANQQQLKDILNGLIMLKCQIDVSVKFIPNMQIYLANES